MSIALIVETGSGVVGANAYADLDDWLAYANEMGQTDVADAYVISPSPADDPDTLDPMKAALIRGTRYIDVYYRSRLPGTKMGGRAQSLEWPRLNAVDQDGEAIDEVSVPIEVIRASFEAGLRELQAPNSLSPDSVDSERTKSETLGPLSVTYMDPIKGTADLWPSIPIIDRILEPLLGSSATAMFGESTRI